jgi:hypothetical protein
MRRARWLLGALVVLVLGAGAGGVGAEEELKLAKPAARPGGTIVATTSVRLDPAKRIFLRLTGPSQIDDLAADPGPVGRGRLQTTLPKVMRQGKYNVAIVTEQGEELAKGAHLRILATETPVITKIVPQPSYQTGGSYSFELVGTNFGYDAADNRIFINDIELHFEKYKTDRLSDRVPDGAPDAAPDGGANRFSSRLTDAACEHTFPCLVGNRRSLRVYGLSLATQPHYRPMHVSVRVDALTSAELPLLLSWAQRGTPIAIAVGTLAIFATAVVLMVRRKAASYAPFGEHYSTLSYLLIDRETNSYSLSHLQLMLWTAAAIVACVYVAASQWLVQWQWQVPKIPDGLAPLLGLSVGTTALAVGATEARGSKGAGPAHPGVGDFLTVGGVLAPERLQFFVWTVLGVIGFIGATLAQDPAAVSEPPKIPENFLPLMGVSSLGYLAGKVVRKPGPIIKQLLPQPPYRAAAPPPAGIRIVGENLSPRAQVWVNTRLILTGGVTVPAPQSASQEFVTELVVDPAAVAAAVAGPPPAPAAAVPPAPGPAPGAPAAVVGAAPAPVAAPAAVVAAPAPPVAAAPVAAAPPAAAGAATVVAVRIMNPDGQAAEL